MNDPFRPVPLKPGKGHGETGEAQEDNQQQANKPSAKRGAKLSGTRNSRELARRPCSVPGILRILVPEQTFTPRAFAVRLVDLSPTGARLETIQLTRDLYLQLVGENRFVRLEVLIPNKKIVSGKLVWIDYDDKLSTFGVSLVPRCDDLVRDCMPEYASRRGASPSPPAMEHFPATTGKASFRFRGIAADADRVLIETEKDTYEISVKDGRFAADVPLGEDRYNKFNFFALAGNRQSEPTPVWIAHRTGHHDTQTLLPDAQLLKDLSVFDEGRAMSFQFKGAPREAISAIRRLEDVFGFAEEVAMRVELHGEAEKAARCLKRGGRFPAKG